MRRSASHGGRVGAPDVPYHRSALAAGQNGPTRGTAGGAWHDGGDDHDRRIRRSSAPAAARTGAAHARSGSCARPAGRCRSTARSAPASPCWSRAAGPTWSPRSPCSRYAGTASTRRSCSATSWCRSRRPASTSTSCAGTGPVVADPIRDRSTTSRGSRAGARATCRYVDEAVRLLVGELGDTPLIGFAGRAVHAGQLSGRGRTVADPHEDQGHDVRRPGALARPLRPAGRHHPGLPAGAGRRPGSPPSSSSTRGPARCPRPTTASTSCRTRPRVLQRAGRRRRAADPLRGGHGRAARRRWARRAPTSSASTGVPRWTSRPPGSARRRRCRATSTRPCCSRRGRSSSVRCAGCSPRAARRRATCSTSATACCRRPTPRC